METNYTLFIMASIGIWVILFLYRLNRGYSITMELTQDRVVVNHVTYYYIGLSKKLSKVRRYYNGKDLILIELVNDTVRYIRNDMTISLNPYIHKNTREVV